MHNPIPGASAVHEQTQQLIPGAVLCPSGATPLLDNQNFDLYYPLFDREMLELFPNGQVPDLAAFDSSPLNLDYLDIGSWNNAEASLLVAENMELASEDHG